MQELRKSLKGLLRETKTRLVESMKMFKTGYQFGLADGAACTAAHTALPHTKKRPHERASAGDCRLVLTRQAKGR